MSDFFTNVERGFAREDRINPKTFLSGSFERKQRKLKKSRRRRINKAKKRNGGFPF